MKKGTCKHYNGSIHNTHCELGIAYRDVVTEPDNQTGIAFRYPCVDWLQTRHFTTLSDCQRENYEKRGTCEKYMEPTAEEIAEDEAKKEAALNRLKLAFPLISKIKQDHKGKNWKGVESCPACGGNLHMTHAAFNGHVWGKCETENCLHWME